MPKVDICIPCYQYGRFLGECLDSVLFQTSEDVRILVIDDASTDDSAAVARRYAAQHSCIEVSVHPVNRGHIATYNEGIAWARSDYLLLLSADDLLTPAALDRAVAVMDDHPDVVLTHGLAEDLLPDQRLPPQPGPHTRAEWQIEGGRDFITRLCRDPVNPVATPTAIVRTSAQQAVGGYRPELTHSGDMEMWLRLATQGAVAYAPVLQAIKRVHGRNMSVTASDNILRDYAQRAEAFRSFFRSEGSGLEDAAFLHRLARRRLAQQAFWTAMAQSGRGHWGTARALLGLVHQLDPSTPFLPLVGGLARVRRPDKRFLALVKDVLGYRGSAR
ncbi:glycosyltransferase family A protein [Inquilinus sp.]|uniref:glycosyltransferase family 2 protein n=1 Tax=Inquilinus sp. TaxID=1932117 RepID=UPI0031E3B4D2